MIVRSILFALALAALIAPAAAAPAPPRGPAVDAAVAYARALGSGDYRRSFGMLTAFMRRYFASVDNYASVWKVDRFSASGIRAVKTAHVKGAEVVTLSESISVFDFGAQQQRKGTVTVPFIVVKEGGAYRVDDEGHPYRAFAPADITVEHDGASVTVRKLGFYLRRLEVTLTLENRGDGFMTFLPYGRSVLRDEADIYRPWETQDWMLTDRQLFLGLRLAAGARYTGRINFEVTRRLDDHARTFSLTVAPALREGGDHPLEFALPPIAVPAP